MTEVAGVLILVAVPAAAVAVVWLVDRVADRISGAPRPRDRY